MKFKEKVNNTRPAKNFVKALIAPQDQCFDVISNFHDVFFLSNVKLINLIRFL